jgi:hypothetical protein
MVFLRSAVCVRQCALVGNYALSANNSPPTLRDVTLHRRLNSPVAYETALLSNLSIEYFPGPVTYSSKKPPMMLRFL